MSRRVALLVATLAASCVAAAPGHAATADPYAGLKSSLMSTSAPTPTSLRLVWSLGDAKRFRLYVNVGRDAPGTPRHLPDAAPIKTITCPCPDSEPFAIRVRGLVKGHIYNFSLYGSDGHGHVRRGVSHPVLARAQGLHLSGLGVIDHCSKTGQLVRDGAGGYHAFGCRAQGSYYTHTTDANGWTRQRVVGARLLAVSADGAGVVATVMPGAFDDSTDRVFATSGSTSSSDLAPPSEIVPTEHCSGEAYDECPTGLVTFPDQDMGVVLAEFCGEVDDNLDRITLATGRPGEPFTKTTVVDFGYDGCSGNSASTPLLGPAKIARDATTGELVVVAWSNVAGSGYYAWTQQPGQPWIGPVKIASTDAATWDSDSVRLDSVVADGGEVWVGLERATDGTHVVHRSSAGTWDDMVRVPGSDAFAQHPVLALEAGGLSVLYVRADPHDRVGGSGLQYVTRAPDGTWSTTRALTRWWGDEPVAVFPAAGTPTVAYLRR